jgi:thiol-disulfide isomerase/thioredoxin
VIVALLLTLAAAPQEVQLRKGEWDAWLVSPGGKLRFTLEAPYGELRMFIVNGEERIRIPQVSQDKDEIVLSIPHYDSRIEAVLGPGGMTMTGTWTKVGSGGSRTEMYFRAMHRNHPQRPATEPWVHPKTLAGRWRVAFSSSEDPAVASFRAGSEDLQHRDHRRLRGTFLTTLGDYRYLVGHSNGVSFELSCFDGAHAFLFKGQLQPDGTIEGDFWSRDTWHETWTAVRDPDASLADPFELTSWNEDVRLDSLAFPDLTGEVRSLADPTFAGKARILKLFGTWCPNCNDEAPYLAELDRRYRERGLRVLGLAFEHTGEFERDAEQVRRYAKLHGIEFPLLLAGISDKQDASKRFPLIDRVRAWPTTIFLRADGSVRAIHTGFAGPATGAEHTKLREDFERLIEELLADGE